MTNYGERYFCAYHLIINIGLKQQTVGYIIAVFFSSVIVAAPITNLLTKRLVVRNIELGFSILYVIMLALNGASILFFSNAFVYSIITFIDVGIFASEMIAMQSV